MKCKNHLNDLTSDVGVCATCLRERLFPILAVQSQDQSQPSISATSQLVPTEKATNFSIIPNIFKSRLKHVASTSANPPSWLTNLFSGKKRVVRRKVSGRGRGMSPESEEGEGVARGRGSGDVAGFVFCISPLVMARPKRREKCSKSLAKLRFDTPESFCKNRSRKVADFGRSRRRS